MLIEINKENRNLTKIGLEGNPLIPELKDAYSKGIEAIQAYIQFLINNNNTLKKQNNLNSPNTPPLNNIMNPNNTPVQSPQERMVMSSMNKMIPKGFYEIFIAPKEEEKRRGIVNNVNNSNYMKRSFKEEDFVHKNNRMNILIQVSQSNNNNNSKPNLLIPNSNQQSQSNTPPRASLSNSDLQVQIPQIRYCFREYAGQVFASLRNMYNVNESEYIDSLCSGNYSELGVSGKSGQFLYITQNQRFIIKTLTHKESKVFRRILPFYFNVILSLLNLQYYYFSFFYLLEFI